MSGPMEQPGASERPASLAGDSGRIGRPAGGAPYRTCPRRSRGRRPSMTSRSRSTAGTIHCLLGGNGSGKSTLIKILAGVYPADPGGTITVGDATIDAEQTTPEWARAAGLHFVHQDLAIFGDLSVAENLAIGPGVPGQRGHPVHPLAGAATPRPSRARALRGRRRPPCGCSAELRPADRTMVAIARALQDQSDADEGILILDEPTVSLPAVEVDILFEALKRYAGGRPDHHLRHPPPRRGPPDRRPGHGAPGRPGGRHPRGRPDHQGPPGRAHRRPGPRPRRHSGATLEGEDLVLEVDRSDRRARCRGSASGCARARCSASPGLVGSGRTSILTTLFGLHPGRPRAP